MVSYNLLEVRTNKRIILRLGREGDDNIEVSELHLQFLNSAQGDLNQQNTRQENQQRQQPTYLPKISETLAQSQFVTKMNATDEPPQLKIKSYSYKISESQIVIHCYIKYVYK